MNNGRVDISGTVTLKSVGGRVNPIFDGYRAHCQIDNSEMQYSYELNLIGLEELGPGDSCGATLTFIFGTIDELNLRLNTDSVVQLNEGRRNIGIFEIAKIHDR